MILRIKQKYLDQLIAGTKKIEYRSFSDFYISRFCEVKGDEITDVKDIKEITFVAGYRKDSPKATFETEIFITEYLHEIPEGLQKGDMLFEIEIGKRLLG